jgi:hypothetical protein
VELGALAGGSGDADDEVLAGGVDDLGCDGGKVVDVRMRVIWAKQAVDEAGVLVSRATWAMVSSLRCLVWVGVGRC